MKKGRGATAAAVGNWLRQAVEAHRAGRIAEASRRYQRVLAAAPAHPDALHLYGVLKFHAGEREAAISLVRQAIAQLPSYPDYHLNLGNMLVELGRTDDALVAYQSALALRPDYADAWSNLGSIFRSLGQLDDAEAAYKRAIELDECPVSAWNKLGELHAERGHGELATHCFCKAIVLDRNHPDAYKRLGIAWQQLGEPVKARQAFVDWLVVDPDNPEARHLLAACDPEDSPERASDEYLAYTFDRFAGNFEQKLMGKLAYRAPALVADRLLSAFGSPSGAWAILDAGCGTGLCGPLLKPWAHRLEGVDLSAGMLARAREKNCYDRLERAELGAWMEDHPDAYDLIVLADTLIYFGPLEGVLGAACAALRPGGRLVFTLEQSDGDGPHAIHHSGRYRHNAGYAQQCVEGAGFERPQIEITPLREEAGRPVMGMLVSCRRP